MNLRPRRTEDPEINLISLIDVLLILVIFFMLSSTFVDEGRLRVQLPSATEQPQVGGGSERIVVFIAVGVLMLVVGWLAPLPPASRGQPQAPQEGVAP